MIGENHSWSKLRLELKENAIQEEYYSAKMAKDKKYKIEDQYETFDIDLSDLNDINHRTLERIPQGRCTKQCVIL